MILRALLCLSVVVFAFAAEARAQAVDVRLVTDEEDAEFQKFVLSDDLSQRAAALAETLAQWERADVTRSV